MRRWLTGLTALALIGLMAPGVFASPLAEKQYETAFSFSYLDVDDFGKTTSLDGDWQWIFGKGYHEVGALVSYLKIDPDSGSSSDATIFGPIYTWNWMPDKEKATGFLSAAYGFVSGDLGDAYDSAWQASVGAKVYVGDAAAIRLEYFIQSLSGDDPTPDQDTSGIRIGISIFGGKK